MVTIGDRPILWHIMKTFSNYGVTDFIICLGYKGYMIKEYFANYMMHSADVVSVDLASGSIEYDRGKTEPWRVTLVETGEVTQTGGRIKRIERFVSGSDFFLTYGDGLADVDIEALHEFHKSQKRYATVTAVAPPGRFGALRFDDGRVTQFLEKPEGDNRTINGGFFVLTPEVFKYIDGDKTVWEHEPLQRLAADGQLSAYRHHGFWQPMDTIREKELLEELWSSGRPPWNTSSR